MKDKTIKVVRQDSHIYNAADAVGFYRGDMGRNKPKVARIYSVHRIEDGRAHCQSWDCWGNLHQEVLKVETLVPYKK